MNNMHGGSPFPGPFETQNANQTGRTLEDTCEIPAMEMGPGGYQPYPPPQQFPPQQYHMPQQKSTALNGWVIALAAAAIIALAAAAVLFFLSSRNGSGKEEYSGGHSLSDDGGSTQHTGREESGAQKPDKTERTEQTPVSYPSPVFSTYEASSFINNGIDEYHPKRAFDGKFETSWQEYVPGVGSGQWIACSARETQYVSSITIYPGNCDNEGSYEMNGRPLRVEISLDGRDYILELTDRFRKGTTLHLDEPVPCRRVTITVLDAVEGTEWEDTAIAEIVIG